MYKEGIPLLSAANEKCKTKDIRKKTKSDHYEQKETYTLQTMGSLKGQMSV